MGCMGFVSVASLLCQQHCVPHARQQLDGYDSVLGLCSLTSKLKQQHFRGSSTVVLTSACRILSHLSAALESLLLPQAHCGIR